MIKTKTMLLVWVGCALSDSGFGQGTVLFGNRAVGQFEVPVTYQFTPVDWRFRAQLFAAPPGTRDLSPVGDSVPFLDGGDAGFFTTVVRAVPGIPPGGEAQVQIVAWWAGLGVTFEEAFAVYGGPGMGRSQVRSVILGGGEIPPPYASRYLQSFSISELWVWDPRTQTPESPGMPRDPRYTGTYFPFLFDLQQTTGIAVSGRRAYVSTRHGGLTVVDLRDPTRIADSSQSLLLPGESLCVAAGTTVAVVGTRGPPQGTPPLDELKVVSIANPDRVLLVGAVTLPGLPQSVALTGDHALVTVLGSA